jgi:hypothetical protein
MQRFAKELVAPQPDLILSGNTQRGIRQGLTVLAITQLAVAALMGWMVKFGINYRFGNYYAPVITK